VKATDRVAMAIEYHQLAAARFERTGAADDYMLRNAAFDRLAMIAETASGAAAVACYVATLKPIELPREWLRRFVETAARCSREGDAALA